MNGFYFILIKYKNGHVAIRDRPYATRSSACSTRARLFKKTKNSVKAIEIHHLSGAAAISAINLKKYV